MISTVVAATSKRSTRSSSTALVAAAFKPTNNNAIIRPCYSPATARTEPQQRFHTTQSSSSHQQLRELSSVSSKPKSTPASSTAAGAGSNSSSSNIASVANVASGYFSSLRYHAAKALTAALSSHERDELLKRLNYNNDDNKIENVANDPSKSAIDKEQERQQHSIAEAVAAARAEAAQRHEEEWERKKTQLLEEAKKAAEARVENNLRIQQRRLAFEQWEKQLKQQQQQQQKPNTETGAVPKSSLALQDPVEQGVKENVPTNAISQEENEADVHPILGKSIIDLGYKRIYLVSAEKLSSIPVWEKQRIYRHDRAKSMATDKLKTLHLGLPGIISIHEDMNGNLSILDGQHRVGMLALLQAKKDKLSKTKNTTNSNEPSFFDLDQVLVEVFPQQERATASNDNNTDTSNEDNDASSHAQDIFVEINKSEPIKLIDMPGVIPNKQRKVITDAASAIQKLYPDMFKPNQNCRSPHINIDNLRDGLFSSDVLSRYSKTIQTAKDLEKWILEQNEILKVQYNNEEQEQENGENNTPTKKVSKVSPTALAKARKFDFYLGLGGMGWLLH